MNALIRPSWPWRAARGWMKLGVPPADAGHSHCCCEREDQTGSGAVRHPGLSFRTRVSDSAIAWLLGRSCKDGHEEVSSGGSDRFPVRGVGRAQEHGDGLRAHTESGRRPCLNSAPVPHVYRRVAAAAGLAARRARHPGRYGGHRGVLETGLARPGSRNRPGCHQPGVDAGQRARSAQHARTQDRCGRRGVAGPAVRVRVAAAQLRATTGDRAAA